MGTSPQLPLEQPFANLDGMSQEELRAELQMWRNIWTWIPEQVKYWLTKIGADVRVMSRQYKGYEGTLGQVHFQVSEIEVEAQTVEYNYADGKRYLELKTVRLPLNAIVHHEWLHDKEQLPDLWVSEDRSGHTEGAISLAERQVQELLELEGLRGKDD